jgi:hypothetical protein
LLELLILGFFAAKWVLARKESILRGRKLSISKTVFFIQMSVCAMSSKGIFVGLYHNEGICISSAKDPCDYFISRIRERENSSIDRN